MCWGTPGIITRILDDLTAEVDFGDGIPRRVILGISADKIKPGDPVIVHAGVIVSKLRYEEIEDVIRYVEELARLAGEEPPQDLISKLRALLEQADRRGDGLE